MLCDGDFVCRISTGQIGYISRFKYVNSGLKYCVILRNPDEKLWLFSDELALLCASG